MRVPYEELDLIGLTEKKAKKVANKAGWHLRVICRDDIDVPITSDYRIDRINVIVYKGTIREVVDVG